jgi:tetratricopeptide (TPR) repeat protein
MFLKGGAMRRFGTVILCVLAVVIGAAISEFQDPWLLPMLTERAPSSELPLATVEFQAPEEETAPALAIQSGDYPLETVSPIEIRKLFERREFTALTARLEEYQARFEEDFHYEYHVYDAYQAFSTTLPYNEELFDAWLNEAPNSFAPYLARGIYYHALGSHSRGTKWANDTTKSQFAGMEYYYDKAAQDASKALDINPGVVRAVTLLINISMSYSDEESIGKLVEHATRASPSALIFRLNHMLSLLPRWGGSYKAMDNYVRSCEKYVRSNPRLAVLKGYKYNDMGRIAERADKHQEAIEFYTKAISFGPYHYYLRNRAGVYYKLKQYHMALRDLDEAIHSRAFVGDNYELRSKVYFAAGDHEASLRDLEMADRLIPNKDSVIESRQWCAENLLNKGHRLFESDKRGAIEKYNMALRFDPGSGDAFYWRGVAYSKLGEVDLSKSALEQAIKANPSHFESYRMMDYLLARERNWDLIIQYWDEFLLHNPNHADALMERSGTYYHKGDMQSALRDLKRSCELGNAKACNQYKKLNR